MALLPLSGCNETSSPPTQPTPPPPAVLSAYSQVDLASGTGAEVQRGACVFIHYTLWRYNPAGTDSKGPQVESSVGSTPFQFTLGTSTVIPGLEQGVTGMRVGGRRRLLIPPSLAYGTTGRPPTIQPNEALVFEIELVGLCPGGL